MVNLKIDPEFRDKIPPMPQEDFEGLKADILRDGYVRDPLVVWQEENILLDGHHRWRVIQENLDVLGDKFTVDYKSFPDRWACIAWICANQLHKHNMTEIQRDKLIQEEYDARQKSIGGQIGNQNAAKNDVEESSNSFSRAEVKDGITRSAIAREHNITSGAVKSAVEVGRGIDKAAKVDPNFKREVLSGEVKAKKSDLAAIRKLESDEEVKAAIEEIRNPPPKEQRPQHTRIKPNPNLDPITKIQKMTGEEREIAERTYNIVEAQKNNGHVSEFTIDDLITEITANGSSYTSSLRQTLVVRSTLLVGDNRKQVAEAINSIIDEITKIKELMK